MGSYKQNFGTISSATEVNTRLSSDVLYHTVHFNKNTATSLRIEAEINGKFYTELAASQTTDYETYTIIGVTGWRLTPTGGDCTPVIFGA